MTTETALAVTSIAVCLLVPLAMWVGIQIGRERERDDIASTVQKIKNQDW